MAAEVGCYWIEASVFRSTLDFDNSVSRHDPLYIMYVIVKFEDSLQSAALFLIAPVYVMERSVQGLQTSHSKNSSLGIFSLPACHALHQRQLIHFSLILLI